MNAERCWLQTYTGVAFYPFAPRPEDVRIEDIAHALSLQCRFSGHVKSFYSVAEHSVRMCWIVPPEDHLWALLHDASEAYLIDLPRPLKRESALGPLYREVEDLVQRAILARFGLPFAKPASVANADLRLLVTEKRDLLGQEPQRWKVRAEPLPEPIRPWPAFAAEQAFLDVFRQVAP